MSPLRFVFGAGRLGWFFRSSAHANRCCKGWQNDGLTVYCCSDLRLCLAVGFDGLGIDLVIGDRLWTVGIEDEFLFFNGLELVR